LQVKNSRAYLTAPRLSPFGFGRHIILANVEPMSSQCQNVMTVENDCQEKMNVTITVTVKRKWAKMSQNIFLIRGLFFSDRGTLADRSSPTGQFLT
jgi:hypothetical protein